MREGCLELDGQGRISEIQNRANRSKVMCAYFAMDPDHSHRIAPDHRTLEEMYHLARAALRERGTLGAADVWTGQMLVGVRNVSVAEKRRAVNYQSDEKDKKIVLRWMKESMGGVIQSGDYTDVVAIDGNKNLVTIEVNGENGQSPNHI